MPSSLRIRAVSMPSMRLPSSVFSLLFSLRELLYPRFLLMFRNTLASSSSDISSPVALALSLRVWNVVSFPDSASMLLSLIHPYDLRVSMSASLRSLYRCRLRRILRFSVRSALVVMDFPVSKLPFSSTVSGLTLTPSRMIDDFSSLFSASLTSAQPMLETPRSRPNIFFIVY